jgi:hypothetical protein
MPHVIREGSADLVSVWKSLPLGPWRWGSAIGRVEGCFLSRDGVALLVAGVVVEFGRPIHPHVLITLRENETAVRLWAPVAVERTEAVKRFVVQVASELVAFGAGPIATTNLSGLL